MTKLSAEWVDAVGQPAGHVLAAQGDGTADWQEVPGLDGARNLPLTTTFFDSAKPYLESNSTVYVNIGDFIFDGTVEFTPVLLKVIGSASADGSTHELRLYDITNATEVAVATWTSSTKGIYKVSIPAINLPAGEAIFEIQVRKTGGAKTRVHYVSME